MSGPVLALDLGGSFVKAGLVAPSGTVVAERRLPSGESGGLASWRTAALAALHDLPRHGDAPVALGISLPGAVDAARGVLVDLVDRLPAGAGLGVASLFDEFGLPVFIDNDAKAALRAERRWGGAQSAEDVVLLTIGTGLGSAALVGGRPPGADPVLGGNQLGHLTVDLDGARCVCGNRGCAELTVSAGGLVAAGRRAGITASDAAAIFAADAQGDIRARRVVERFIEGLAATVVNAVHAYQPALVVLAGGVTAAADRFLAPVRLLVAERAWTLPRGRTRLDVSTLGGQIGILGAAALALDGRHRTDAVAPR